MAFLARIMAMNMKSMIYVYFVMQELKNGNNYNNTEFIKSSG